MKKQLIGLALVMAASSVASAGNYTAEVKGYGDKTDFDIIDFDRVGVAGTYYFNGVNTDGKPLAEAAFLDQATNISLDVAHIDVGVTYSTLGVEVFVPNTILYGAFKYTTSDSDTDDSDSWEARLGVIPVEGLLLSTRYIKDQDYYTNLEAKYVMPLGNGQSLNLYGRIELPDDEHTYTLGGDYYFTPMTSVGVELEDFEYDNGGGYETYALRAKHFVNESLYVSAFYKEFDESVHVRYAETSAGADSDVSQYGIEVGMRF